MQESFSPAPSQTESWLQARVVGRYPIHSVILRISAVEPGQPNITRYLIGDMPAGLLPFGVDHPESLEAAMDEAATKFGIRKEDWTELSTPPSFVDAFDAAIDEAIERASEALGSSNGGEDPVDPDRWP